MKDVLILGATGTIGQNTLEIIRNNRDKFHVKAIVANSNIEAMAEIAREFKPEFIGVNDASKYAELKTIISSEISIVGGQDAIVNDICMQSYDVTISGISGFAALKPTLAAMQHSKVLGLANKESIICAGKVMLQQANALKDLTIIPVDSEHNAIYQLLHDSDSLEKITITASGGAFRNLTRQQLRDVTVEMALQHPNWSMGPKVTIDSASLLNKGLEIIEAKKLFNLQASQIEAIIHPQSIVHAMLHYKDGAVFAHLGFPSMQLPISLALNYPNRIEHGLPKLDFANPIKLDFYPPDFSKHPLLKLAIDLLDEDEFFHIALNAADEIAVDAFLKGRLSFLGIERVIFNTLNSVEIMPTSSLEEVIYADEYVRRIALNYI